MSGQGLSNTAWALAKLNRPSLRACTVEVFEEISREVRERVHTFDIQVSAKHYALRYTPGYPLRTYAALGTPLSLGPAL